MPRHARVRIRAATAGLAGILGAGLLVTGLVASPSFGVPADDLTGDPALTGGPVPTVSSSTPTSGTTATVTSRPSSTSTAPASATSRTPCYTYTPPSTPAPNTVLASYDFEDGATGGWSGSNGATVENSGELAASGARSLHAEGLGSTGYISRYFSPAPTFGWYKVTAKVRVGPGQPSVPVVLRGSGGGGQVVSGSARAVPDAWTELTAYFRPSTIYRDWDCNGTLTGTEVPGPVQLQLTIGVAACGAVDRPFAVFLDDVVLSTTAVTGTALPVTPPPSPPPTANCVTAPPPPPCLVNYRIQSQWTGGYTAIVDVRNPGATTYSSWKLTWAFPDDQTITTLWGGSFTQSGRSVTVTSPSWAPLAASGTVSLGFVGSGDTPGSPTSFSLNGQLCG